MWRDGLDADVPSVGAVTASWTSVGASVAVLVLVGMGLPSAVAAGQPSRSAASSDRALAALADEAPASRVQALLTRLPRLESDPSLRGRPDLHRAVAAMPVGGGAMPHR